MERKPSKLRAMPVTERMRLVLPRTHLATDGQLEHLAQLFPEGGQPATQALLNLMQSGVKDCIAWSRDCWHPEAIGTVTGSDDDKLHLIEAVPLPPTAGSTLIQTELCLETMLNQVRLSLAQVGHDTVTAPNSESLLALAAKVPRQVALLVQRLRYTQEVEKCFWEDRQIGTVMRPYADVQRALGERQLRKDIPEGERATLVSLQTLLHEQLTVMKKLADHEAKGAEALRLLWQEQLRVYNQGKDELAIDVMIDNMVARAGFEYDASPMLVTTDFTHNLRWAYFNSMGAGGKRALVVVGPPGSGKTGMLWNIGQLLGTLPTIMMANAQLPAEETYWRRRFEAAKAGCGGSMAPFIISRANRAPEASLEVALRLARECEVALCVTMSPGPDAQSLQEGVFAGQSVITMPEIDLRLIAEGRLSADGLQQPEAHASALATILDTLSKESTKQSHYDFGARTLMQLCSQISLDRQSRVPEHATICSVVQRCLAPKLASDDLHLLKRLIVDQGWKVDSDFKEGELVPASMTKAGRWATVAESIGSITKIEPDCAVLPVPESDEAAFFEDFCKFLNKSTSALVRLPGKLSEITPEELLGTMPTKGEEVKDGLLVTELRKAMEDHPSDQTVWVAMMTGNCGLEMTAMWECLHELLSDAMCLNLATGEQLRLTPNLRFLLVMPEAGAVSLDTFSRTAVVYTHP